VSRCILNLARKSRQGPKALAIAVLRGLIGPKLRSKVRRFLAAKVPSRSMRPRRSDADAAQCPGVPGLVSVVLPFYNQANLLADSIESVLRQTYTDFELILVDDGSSDRVEEVLGRYVGHRKIRVLTQASQTLLKALSNGFEFARGEFWTWTSADNLMHPDQLARQVAFLRAHPGTSAVHDDVLAIDSPGISRTDPTARPPNPHQPSAPEVHLGHSSSEINVASEQLVGPCFLYRNTVGRLICDYDPTLRNDRAYYEQTRPELLRSRRLPRPFRTSKKAHILIQIDDFDQGGLENVVLGLAEGLRRRGMDVSLLVLRTLGPAAEQARRAGFPVLTLPEDGRDGCYRSLLREQKVGLVNAHYSTYGARDVSGAGIPFVQVVHNSYVWLEGDAIGEYRAANRYTTGYVCVSAEVARYCAANLGLSVSKMVVVPNGIDGARLDAARTLPSAQLRHELGLSPDDFVFLNVASIHGTKGQKVLIKALAEVIKTQPQVRLVIVGSARDPRYEVQFRRMIRDLGVQQHVILAGQRPDVGRFYWMADAFVLPSFWEGWSLSLTEAVYTGLPVVATDVGGAGELLSGGGGRLVKPPFTSVCELNAHTIGRLVRHEDPEFVANLAESLRETCSTRHRISVPEFKKRLLDQERMVDLHETILDWFLQGGEAIAARAWTRTMRQPEVLPPGFVQCHFD